MTNPRRGHDRIQSHRTDSEGCLMPVAMLLSREVRRVPLDYEPPGARHGHQARYDAFYVPTVEAWLAARDRWESGEDPDRARYPNCTFEEWAGDGPDPAYYYPGRAWPDGVTLGIQMYETVSEGTPISPVYPDTDEGRREMAAHLAGSDTGLSSSLTEAEWLRIIAGEPLAKDIHTGEVL